jgi:hypothetical protein
MSATYAPFGLKPVFHPSGITRATNYTGAYDTNAVFYSGTVVSLNNSGTASTLGVASNTPTSNQRLAGVFGGVEYTDASGRRTVSKWFGPALGTATNVVMWVFMDDQIVYEAQANGSLANTAVGQEFNLTANSSGQIIGNGGLGTSLGAIDPTDVSAGGQGQVEVVNLGRGIDNAWGDTYTVVEVKLANTKFDAVDPE